MRRPSTAPRSDLARFRTRAFEKRAALGGYGTAPEADPDFSVDSTDDRHPGERAAPVAGTARRFPDRHAGAPAGFGASHLVDRHDLARRLRHGAAARRTGARPRDDRRRRGLVVGEAELQATISDDRRIEAIEVVPERPGIQALVGTQGGSYLRTAIDEALPGEREAATPLHLLLDDIAGTSLIAGFVWMRHRPIERRPQPPTEFGVRKGRVICSGLRPGGSAQMAVAEGRHDLHGLRRAGPIAVDDDPLAWHEFPARPVVSMRRHRRVDVIPDGAELVIDSFFRDSCWEPDGTEMALHEYTVSARVDAASLTLTDVSAHPHVLPFPECQWAPEHVVLLLGQPVRVVPYRRADDAHRAAGLHAPQRHAALPRRGARARPRARSRRLLIDPLGEARTRVDYSWSIGSGSRSSRSIVVRPRGAPRTGRVPSRRGLDPRRRPRLLDHRQ